MTKLGDLIVELSLDTEDFNRSLFAAKKNALDAVKQMESALSNNLSISVDDSELTNLNKHLNSKIKHLKEVNDFFKKNPVTVFTDDSLLTDLNELLHKTTKKHTIEIEYKYKQTVYNESEIEDKISIAVENGFKTGIQRGLEQSSNLIEKTVEKSVTDGVSKAGTQGESQPSPGTGRSIEDLIKEVKDGFSGAADDSKAEVASKAIEVVLKPGQDLLTGFFEGFTNDFGKELSAGFRQSLGETMGLNMEAAGQKLGDSFSKLMGVNVEAVKKNRQKETLLAQNIQPQNNTLKNVFTTIGQPLQSISTGVAFNTGLKIAGVVQSAITKNKSNLSEDIPLPYLEPKKTLQEPTTVQQPDLIEISSFERTARQELKQLSVFEEIPLKVKQAIETAIEVGDEIDNILNEAIQSSKAAVQANKPGAETQKINDIIAQSKTIKAAHSKYNKTIKNVIDANASIGDYASIPLVYSDFKKVNSDSRKTVDKLIAEAKNLNATPEQINQISQAKTPITSGEKSIKQEVSKSYLKVKKEADLIAKANQQGIQASSSNFKTLGEKEAQEYIAAFKKILGIASPSKIFIGIGAAIVAGLAVGLIANKPSVQKAASDIVSTVKNTTEENASSFNDLIENAVNSENQAYATQVKNIFNDSRKTARGSNPISQDIGKALNINSKALSLILPLLGNKPTSVEQNIPMSHLGKFYMGNTDVVKFDNKNNLSPIIDAISVFLDDNNKQTSGYRYLGAFDSQRKFTNSSQKPEYDMLLKDLRALKLTLGGFGIVKTKTGINAVDIYDWAGAKSKQKKTFADHITIPSSAIANSAIISLFNKFPAIAKKLNFEKDDLGGYTMHANLGKTRKQIEEEAVANKEVLPNVETMSDQTFKRRSAGLISINPGKTGGINISDSLHDIIGGQSYIQQRQVPLKKEKELKALYSKIYKQLQKEGKAITEETVFTHPDFLEYMYADEVKRKKYTSRGRTKPRENVSNTNENQGGINISSILKNFNIKEIIFNQLSAILPTGIKNVFAKIGGIIPKGILGIIPQGLAKTFSKIGFDLIEGFLNGFSAFSSKSKIIPQLFNSLVVSIKKVLRMSSPSLIMKGVGLNFGQSFGDAAIASLTYSFHRISQEYKKFVDQEMKNPALTKQEKKRLSKSRNQIDKDLQNFAQMYRHGKFIDDKDAMSYLGKHIVRPNRNNMDFLGFDKARQNSITKAARADFDILRNYDKNAPILKYQDILPIIRSSSQKVSTLLLASHKISEEYKKRIDVLLNTPGISASQKHLYTAQKNLIDKKLQRFVTDVSSGALTDKQIEQSIMNAYKFSRQKAKQTSITYQDISSIVKQSGKDVSTSKQPVFKQIFDSIVDGFSSTSGSGIGVFSLGGYLRKAVGKSVQNMIEKNLLNTGRMGALSDLGMFKIAPQLFKMVTGKGTDLTSLIPLIAPLLPGLIGKKAGDLGQFASGILRNNNLFQSGGIIPSIIKSITGIDLGRQDKLGQAGERGFGISKILGLFVGSQNPLLKALSNIPFIGTAGKKIAGIATSIYGDKLPALGQDTPRDNLIQMAQKQIKSNIASTGIEGTAAKDLAKQVLTTLFDSFTIKNPGNSNVLRGILEKNSKIVNGIRDLIINKIVDFSTNSGLFTSNRLGRIATRIAGSYASGDVEGAVNMTARTAQTLFKTSGIKNIAATMGIRIDAAQVKMAVTALLLGISAFHKAFTQEGLNIGKAIMKGFSEGVANWKNAGADVKREVRKALGAENPKEIWEQIMTQWKRGIVVPKNVFKDFWNAIGSQFKRDKMKAFSPDQRDDIQGNMLSFIFSAVSVFAPITTFATSLLPLVAPLLPLFGAIGGAVFMVRNQIQGLIKTMLELEPLQRRLDFLGGSKEKGKGELNYAINTAKELNVPAKAATDAYSQIAIAASYTKMQGQGAKDLFEGISASLGALGITGQDAELVFMAYTQMLSKGKISMEELRQQLGERFPPAMGVFAKALDVPVSRLVEMSSEGSLLSEEVLPKVAKQLKIDYSSAAKGANGFSISLTRLQNVGMEMSVKLVNAFGGVFAFVTDIFTNLANGINAILDEILLLISSFVIGVTATLGVGLVFILKMNPIKTFLANTSGILTTGIAALMGALAPFFMGILADVVDDLLGAQKTLMQNMYEGVSNGILWFLSSIDSLKRKFTGQGLFDVIVGKPGENPFKPIIDGITSITKIIPSGVIEVLALVLMFEQLTTLIKHFGVPMFKGFMEGLNGIRTSLVGMKNEATSLKGIQSLFTNTFDMENQAKKNRVNKKGERVIIGTRLTDEINYAFHSAKQVVKTQRDNLFGSLFGALVGTSRIFGGFFNGIDKAKASFKNFTTDIRTGFQAGFFQGIGATITSTLQLIGNGFKGLKEAASFAWTNGFIGSLQAIGGALQSLGSTINSVGIIKAFTLLFSRDGMIASSARAAWGTALQQMFLGVGKALKSLAKIGIEAGLALAFMFLARSDFANPMQKSINDMAMNVNGALGEINNSLSKIDNASKNMGATFKNNSKDAQKLALEFKNIADSIPSKGLQLDIAYVFGMKEKGYTTDDHVKNVNKALRGELDKDKLDFFERNTYDEIEQERNYAKGRNTELSKTLYAKNKISQNQKDVLSKYDIKGLISDTDYEITLGVQQVIDNLEQADTMLKDTKASFGNLGLTQETQQKYKERVKDVANRLRQNDIEVMALSAERSKVLQEDTPESKKRAAELSKQITNKSKERTELSKDVKGNADAINVLLEQAKQLKDTANSAPIPVRDAYLKVANEMTVLAEKAKKIMKDSVPVDPFEQIYKTTIDALNRFQVAYDRFSAAIDRTSAIREEAIYSSGASPGDTEYNSRRSGIIAQQQKVSGLSRIFTMRKAALDLISTMPDNNINSETREKINELKKQTQEDATNLATARSSLAKSKYDLKESLRQQQKQVDDYVRTVTREIEQGRLEIKKANQEIKNINFKTKINEALTDLGDNEFTRYVDGLVSILDQINQSALDKIESEKIGLDFKNRIQDSRIEATELIRTLPSGKDLIGVTEDIETNMKKAFTTSSLELDNLINQVRNSAAKVTEQTNKTVKESQAVNNNTKKLNENILEATSSIFNMNTSLQETATLLEKASNIKIDPYSNATPAPTSVASAAGTQENTNTWAVYHPTAGKGTTNLPTQLFGASRSGGRIHSGVDIAAPTGTPVYASASGKVKKVHTDPTGYGKFIEIYHQNNQKFWTTLYAHLDSFAVQVNDIVKAGQLIGTVGNTGNSRGPHLHFEATYMGNRINPTAGLEALKKQFAPNSTNTSSVPSGGVDTGKIAAAQKQREAELKKQEEAAKKRAEALAKQNEASAIRSLTNFLYNTPKTVIESRDATDALINNISGLMSEYLPTRIPPLFAPEYIKAKEDLKKLQDNLAQIDRRLKETRNQFVKSADNKPSNQLIGFEDFRKSAETIKDEKARNKILQGLNDAEKQIVKQKQEEIKILEQAKLDLKDVKIKEIEARIQLIQSISKLKREYEREAIIKDLESTNRQGRLEVLQKNNELFLPPVFSEAKPDVLELPQQNTIKQLQSALDAIPLNVWNDLSGKSKLIPDFSKSNADIPTSPPKLNTITSLNLTELLQQQSAVTAEIEGLKKIINTAKELIETNKAEIRDIENNESIYITDKEKADRINIINKDNTALEVTLNTYLKEVEKLQQQLNNTETQIEDLGKLFGGMNLDTLKTELLSTEKQINDFGKFDLSDSKIELRSVAPININSLLSAQSSSIPELQRQERDSEIEKRFMEFKIKVQENQAKGLITSQQAEQELRKNEDNKQQRLEQSKSQFELDTANQNKTELEKTNQIQDLRNSVNYEYSLNEFQQKIDEINKAAALKQAEIATFVMLSEEERTDLIKQSEEFKKKQIKRFTDDNAITIKDGFNAIKASITSSRINWFKSNGGNEFVANRMQRDLDTAEAKRERERKILDAQRQLEAGKMKQEDFDSMKGLINTEYEEKLRSIRDASKDIVSTIRQIVRENLINDLSSGFTDVIMGVRSLDDVLKNLANTILNQLVNIAIKSLLQSLLGAGGMMDGLFGMIGGWFGGGKGGGGTGTTTGMVPPSPTAPIAAFAGGEVSSIGIVPNYADGGIIESINNAFSKEKAANGGITPVLAVLTPGERVLSVADNTKFESMGLDKVIKNNGINSVMNYAMGGNVSNSELKVRNIMNFASGGITPPSPGLGNISQPTASNTTINVPVTIENQDNSQSPSIDPAAMHSAIKTAVIVEIQRQQRQGGTIPRR